MSFFNIPPRLSKAPIVREFFAAGRLANEWRDTILYASLAALAVSELIQNKTVDVNLLNIGKVDIFQMASLREIGRMASWGMSAPQKLVGDHSAGIDCQRLKLSSAIGALGAYLLSEMTKFHGVNEAHSAIPMTIVLMGASGILVSTSPANVWKAYKNIMWDWPRKNGGGGTTETQRLKDGFKKWAVETAEGIGELLPQPKRKTAVIRLPAAHRLES